MRGLADFSFFFSPGRKKSWRAPGLWAAARAANPARVRLSKLGKTEPDARSERARASPPCPPFAASSASQSPGTYLGPCQDFFSSRKRKKKSAQGLVERGVAISKENGRDTNIILAGGAAVHPQHRSRRARAHATPRYRSARSSKKLTSASRRRAC